MFIYVRAFLPVLLMVLLSVPTIAQNLKISGSYVDSNLQDVLHDIENLHPIRFFYREKWLFTNKINQQFSQLPLIDVLDLLLKNSDLTYLTYGDDKVVIGNKDRIGNLKSQEYFLARQSIKVTDIDRRFQMLMVGDSAKIENATFNQIKLELVDKYEGNRLEGVAVYFEKLELTFNSGNTGQVDLVLPNGIYQMEARRIGYEPFIGNLRVFSKGEVKIEMELEAIELREVVVSGESPDRRLMNPQAGIVSITPKQIKDMPVFLGEADVIKTILTIPGVTSIGEGAPGFFVRGGNIDQNLILQDEVVFSNSSHAFGFFSMFNPDLISNVRLYKGNIPAQFGGRLSSVLDVQLKGNNYTSTNINGGVGTVISKLAIETPVVKEKVLGTSGVLLVPHPPPLMLWSGQSKTHYHE